MRLTLSLCAAGLFLLAAGCREEIEYITNVVDTVEVHRADTVYLTVVDSVYVTVADTVYIGFVDTVRVADTVLVERVDTLVVERLDTVVVERVRTVVDTVVVVDTVYLSGPPWGNAWGYHKKKGSGG